MKAPLTTAGGIALVAALAACSPSRPPAVARAATAPRDPRATPARSPSAAPDPERAALAALNAAVRGDTVDTVHGVAVADPYRALETDSPATQQWIDAQTRRSEGYLAARDRPARRARLEQLHAIGHVSSPAYAGGAVFYLERDAAHDQPVLMVAARGRDGTWSPRMLVDPTTGGFPARAVDWYFPSPHGRYVAYGLSDNGDERSVLDVVEVATGRRVYLAIAHTKWCRLSWLDDESGFFYTRYPREGEAGYDAAEPDTYFPRLFFHDLRASRAAVRRASHATPGPGPVPEAVGARDPLVFSGRERTDLVGASVSRDGRWVVVNLFKGWSRQDVLLIDRRARVAPGAQPVARPVVTDHPARSTGWVYRGSLYVLTNLGAPKYRVVAAPVERAYRDGLGRTGPGASAAGEAFARAPAGPWRGVVPEGEHPIDDVTVAAGRMAVLRSVNISAEVTVSALDGSSPRVVTLPGIGSVAGLSAEEDEDGIAIGYQSFFHPPTVLLARAAGGRGPIAPETVARVATDFAFERYVLERETVRSRDGTPINVFVMRHRDLARDGRAPVLLNGYGGFNLDLSPSFQRHVLYWLERGGVYAVANLRGGSEFGEAWHRAGALENKERVFEDFEAATRWFTTSGWSSPARIAIHGGSNGGLLMGAMLTRAPDAFRATASYVGLYDMVRYHRFPPAAIWTSEYGSAEDPAQFRTLLGYSPYHRLRDGVRYPAAWIETADHDTRVYWGHSTKFAARLQDAQSGEHPIYFYMRRNLGHGAGTRRSDQVDRYTRMYTFVESELGVTDP